MRFIHEPSLLRYSDLPTETSSKGGRLYCTPEGKKLPSITTVLGARGKEHIIEWRKRVGEEEANRISRFATSRGSGLHSIAEKYIGNEDVYIDPVKVMPHVKALFMAVKPVIDSGLSKVYLQEKPLYSDFLKIAGRVDLVGRFENKNSVIDFKTSTRVKSLEDIEDYMLQACAYAIMTEEQTGIGIPNLVIIMAVDNSPTPIVFRGRRDNYIHQLLERITDYYENYHRA